MQRATSSNVKDPDEDLDGPISKRQKLAFNCEGEPEQMPHPSCPPTEGNINRNKVLDRQAEEAGDTRWVLNRYADRSQLPDIKVSHAAWTLVDSTLLENDAIESLQAQGQVNTGRKSFGKFNKHLEVRGLCRS